MACFSPLRNAVVSGAKLLAQGVTCSRHEPERAQRVEDHRDVDEFLQQRSLNGRKIAEGGSDHPSSGQADAGNDALQSNPP